MNTSAKPNISIRSTTLFGWLIPILLVFNYINYREGIDFNLYICIFFVILIMGVGTPEFIRIIKIKNKKESKLTTVIIALIVVTSVITMLELKSQGVFIWNELYFIIPLTVFSLIAYTVAFISEDRHHIKVYLALDGIHYVKA